MTIRTSTGAEVRRLNRHPKQPWVASATPAVSQNLRLRYNNVDVAASANGVSGDYFNVYGMTFSEGNTFNQEQLNGRAQVVVLDSNTRRQLFPIKQMWLAR